jgi:hypothetical protein
VGHGSVAIPLQPQHFNRCFRKLYQAQRENMFAPRGFFLRTRFLDLYALLKTLWQRRHTNFDSVFSYQFSGILTLVPSLKAVLLWPGKGRLYFSFSVYRSCQRLFSQPQNPDGSSIVLPPYASPQTREEALQKRLQCLLLRFKPDRPGGYRHTAVKNTA